MAMLLNSGFKKVAPFSWGNGSTRGFFKLLFDACLTDVAKSQIIAFAITFLATNKSSF